MSLELVMKFSLVLNRVMWGAVTLSWCHVGIALLPQVLWLWVLQINLRLILVSGKTKEFLFSPNDSAADIAKHVYDNWPMDWEEEQVSSPNILRLIYQGRFLHGNVTLGALKLPFGKTTVMHLVARETLPEPNSQGQRNREKTGESNCCVIL
uniref:Ubiquitin-like protein 3 n=1 Tax=Falco tinnunculus TaxID=100819 RepID=A0A8C4UBZ5_FALTI